MDEKSADITQVLMDCVGQPRQKVAERLMPVVYDELRNMANNYLRHERKGHTLQPTALVHEAFMKLVDQSKVDWQGRTHFLAVSAEIMRRILIDNARAKKRQKRGGDRQRVMLDDDIAPDGGREFDLLDIHDAAREVVAGR